MLRKILYTCVCHTENVGGFGVFFFTDTVTYGPMGKTRDVIFTMQMSI